MSGSSGIILKTSIHVRSLFAKKQVYPGLYHNLEHTVEVVENAKEISEAMKLSNEQSEIVLLAAWFHDTGYLETRNDHEEHSIEIMRKFLSAQKYPVEKIEQASDCIRATKIPQKPTTLLEQVVADADLLHLGKKESIKKGELLRLEMGISGNGPMNEAQWIRQSIDFYLNHSFHTPYAIAEYHKQKEQNISKLQKRLKKIASKAEKSKAALSTNGHKPGRGVETMFRIASNNHMELSSIADNKANIMISVPSIIISIVMSIMLRKLNENPELMVPTFLLLLVCVATIVFAILSTRPKITSATFTRNEIKEKNINLLFFGNFFGMSYDDYHWGMNELMKNRTMLYDTLIKDIYYLGQVLGKKYRYLRISYNIFLFGMIAAVLAYIIALTMYGANV